MVSARTLSIVCLVLVLLAAGGAMVPALAAAGPGEGPLISSPTEIREIQRILEKEEYLRPRGRRSGELDDATVSALRAFQAAHFIPASGQVDFDTMGLLVSHGLRSSSGRVAKSRPSGAGLAGPEERVALTSATGTAPERSMPATGSPIFLAAAIGALLLGGGLAIMSARKV